MIPKKRIGLTILALLLTACTQIPPYTRPAAPIPATWPSGPAYPAPHADQGSAIAADLHWRDFFTDERLQHIIATALQNNRNLRLAALNVERARAMYRIQRAELLPSVAATGSGYKERVPADLSSSGQARIVEEYNLNLGVSSWEIDFFGFIRSLEQKALEEYLATEQARRSAQILLIAELARAYLSLAADRENLQLAQSTLESQQAAYNLIRRRFEVGLAPELTLRQIQTRVDAARVDVARYTGLIAQDENALNLLAGAPVSAELSMELLSKLKPPREFSPGISSELLLHRPDILQAEYLLKAANANIGAARSAFFPRIALTGAIGTASSDLSGLFSAGSGSWTFAPRIVMPIFDARTWAAYRVSQADQQIAITRYEGSIQAAFRDVADTLAQRGSLTDQLQAQQSLVDASTEAYRLSNARYEKGIDIYLNVLDAQRSLYAAQQGMIAIRLAALANHIRLYAVLGGGADQSLATPAPSES